MPFEPEAFWSMDVSQLLSYLQATADGLSVEEAGRRLSQYGPNILKPPTRSGPLWLLLRQFKSPIILILVFAAGLSFFLGDRSDGGIILGIVLASGLLGFRQERGAASAVAKLLVAVQTKVGVLRGGDSVEIPLEQVVPGDIVLLSAGSSVPGDCRVIESKDLFVDEATLTGETYPAEKSSLDVTKDYTYDHRERLTGVDLDDDQTPDRTWEYDKVGNWTDTTQNDQGGEERTANDDNQYATIEDATAPVYDAKGNLTDYEDPADDDWDYLYDWANRLLEVKKNDTTVALFEYDALNRRVTKVANSVTTRYVYDGARVIEEYESATLKRRYAYGSYVDDVVMMEIPSGQPNAGEYYYLKDRRFSVAALTDADGTGTDLVMELYKYSAFGLMSMYDGSGGGRSLSAYGNPYGYTGRRWDRESELWDYRNRAYNPKLGRFLQRDPAGYSDGVNLYAYVMNNPARYIDPTGRTSIAAGFLQFGSNQSETQRYSDMVIPQLSQQAGSMVGDWMVSSFALFISHPAQGVPLVHYALRTTHFFITSQVVRNGCGWCGRRLRG